MTKLDLITWYNRNQLSGVDDWSRTGSTSSFSEVFNMRSMIGICSCLVALISFVSPAIGGSHLWRFSEFYSSPDRSIQFIEMFESGGSDVEFFIGNHWFETNSYNADHSDLLGSDIGPNTANKKFLVGTQSYAALPGVPVPDYIVPDGIINPDGDTVVWWFYQTIVIPPFTMPSDGRLSITIDDPQIPSYSIGINSPTNFAGDTGSIVLPSAVPMFSTPGFVSIAFIGVLIAFLALKRRAHDFAR